MSLVSLLAGACGGGGESDAAQSSVEGISAVTTVAADEAPPPAVLSPTPAPAPSVPTAGTATLSWTAPSGASVAGYRVYYGTVSGSYLQALGAGLSTGNSTTYVVTGLPRGYMYYFAVTAVDARGEESAFSNEATKHVQ